MSYLQSTVVGVYINTTKTNCRFKFCVPFSFLFSNNKFTSKPREAVKLENSIFSIFMRIHVVRKLEHKNEIESSSL